MEANEKIFVTKSSLPDFNEYIEEISSIWENHWLTNNGEKSKKLEQNLLKYMNVSNLSLFTNGHLALELTIQAMELTGEVITTPYTFASTTHAITRNGLTPVFCDVNKSDFTIDVSKIEDLITDQTSAIIPVHVYGNVCDVEGIQKIADKYDLKVIYDAAHVFGTKFKNIGIGNFGDASMFSFHATKVFNTIEGGCVTYNSDDLGWTLSRLRNFGIKNEIVVDWVGSNAKMNEFQAAMGLCNLRSLEKNIHLRRILTERYFSKLRGVKGIQLNEYNKDVESNYAYFPIIVHEEDFGLNRDELITKLNNKNIFPRKYFYPLTSEFECYKNKFDSSKTPVALELSKKVMTLPLYSDLSLEIVDTICDIIKKSQVSVK